MARLLRPHPAAPVFSVGLKKTVLESLSVGPIYIFAVNVWTAAVIKQGYRRPHPVMEVRQAVSDRFWPAICTAWCVVAPAQLFSHCFVPPHLKLLYLNTVSALWNIILSGMLCRSDP